MNFKRLVGIALSFLIFNSSLGSAMSNNESIDGNDYSTQEQIEENESSDLPLLEKLFIGTGVVAFGTACVYGLAKLARGNQSNRASSGIGNQDDSSNNNTCNDNAITINMPPSKTNCLLELPLSTNFSLALNRNIRNTKNLCYYDSLIQQLYSLVSFRKFLNRTNPQDLPEHLVPKLNAFKELFSMMAQFDPNDAWIEQEYFQQFATTTLGNIGDQGVILDVLSSNDFINYFMQSSGVTIPFILKENLHKFIQNGTLLDGQGKKININPIDGQFTFLIVDADSNALEIQDPGPPKVSFNGTTYVPTAITVYDGTSNGQYGHYVTHKMGELGRGSLWDIYDGLNHGSVGSNHWLVPFSPMPGLIPPEQYYHFMEKSCAMITFTDIRLLPDLA